MHYRGVGFTYTKLGNNAQEVYLLLAMCFRKKKKRHPAWPLPPLRASSSQPLQIRLFRAAQSRGRGLASLCYCQPEYSIISLENHSLPTFIVCEKEHIADEDQKFYMYVDKPLRRQGNLIPHFHIHFLSPSRFLEIWHGYQSLNAALELKQTIFSLVRFPNLYFGSRLGVHCTIPKKQ